MMMDGMKSLLPWLCLCACAGAADLSQAHNVYILPMTGGLDQYLANRLTETGVLQVVTDPKRADVVFTDRLGSTFEDKMQELYPPPPAPAAKPAEKAPADASAPPGFGDTVNKLAKPPSSFGRGKGTIFLVSVKSRDVLWSTLEKPKDTTSSQLDRAAVKIVSELKKSAGAK
jgi:hypothetical protein